MIEAPANKPATAIEAAPLADPGAPPEAPPTRREARISGLRRFGYVAVAVMIMAVLGMSIAQMIIYGFGPNPPAYGSVLPDANGWPQEDKRGAFLSLFPNGQAEERFKSTLVELLATTQAGVVDTESGAHLYPDDIAQILIQSAAVGEPTDYIVYRRGAEGGATYVPMKHAKQPGGKRLIMQLASGRWEPGSYIIDVPAEGMFGGRTYFHFFVDAPPTGQ
jgi:hypothetical protein